MSLLWHSMFMLASRTLLRSLMPFVTICQTCMLFDLILCVGNPGLERSPNV
jgi:hypothetical protein